LIYNSSIVPRFFIPLIIIVGFAILVGSLFAVWQTLPKIPAQEAGDAAQDMANNIESELTPVVAASDPIRGNPAAPVTIIEYSDFECPHCADAEPVLRELLKKYPDKIRLVWKDLPDTTVRFKSLGAHVAARCAQAQGKFWEYHDLLFERQLELSPDNYALWAKQLGLNTETFAMCLAQQRGRETVQSNRIDGLRLGIDATPYFFIGKERISGVVSLDEFVNLLQL